MKLTKYIHIQLFAIALFFSFFSQIVGMANAQCGYSLTESGCTITYDGTGTQIANGGSCSQFAGEVEYAADGTVCATSPNSCDYSTCSAINTITKCQTGKCSNSEVVPHPWSVCSSSTASCTVVPTPIPPTPTPITPTPTIYVPPPTPFVPPPAIPICPIPNAVTNVVVECPYCQ